MPTVAIRPLVAAVAVAAVVVAVAACAGTPREEPATSAASGSASIAGRTWTLVELDGRPAIAGIGGETPNLRLLPDSARVEGSTGCNRFFGRYERTGSDGLRFAALGSTRRACADPAPAQQEARFTAALEATRRHELRGDTLVLRDDAAPRVRLVAPPR